jgi:hypothetical protein
MIWALSILLLVASTASESIHGVMSSLISAIGVMVSIYYGLTGLACVWYYRKTLTQSAGSLVMRGLWPGLSALFLLFLGARQLPDLGTTVGALTLGTLALGGVPLVYFPWKQGPDFYRSALEHHPGAP